MTLVELNCANSSAKVFTSCKPVSTTKVDKISL